MSKFNVVTSVSRTSVTIYAQDEAKPPKSTRPFIRRKIEDDVFTVSQIATDVNGLFKKLSLERLRDYFVYLSQKRG